MNPKRRKKKIIPVLSLSLSLVFFFTVWVSPLSRILGVSVYTAGALGGYGQERNENDSRVGVFFGGGTCLKGRLETAWVDCLVREGGLEKKDGGTNRCAKR